MSMVAATARRTLLLDFGNILLERLVVAKASGCHFDVFLVVSVIVECVVVDHDIVVDVGSGQGRGETIDVSGSARLGRGGRRRQRERAEGS